MEYKKVIIVEDDKMLSTLSVMFLKNLGYQLEGVYQNAEEAIQRCKVIDTDVVLMDIHIEGEIDGIHAAKIIQDDCMIPVIFVTSDSQDETIKKIMSFPIYSFLLKPIDKETLQTALEFVITRHQQKKILKRKGIIEKFNPADHAVIVVSNGHVLYFNTKAENLFGLKKNQTTEIPLKKLMPDNDFYHLDMHIKLMGQRNLQFDNEMSNFFIGNDLTQTFEVGLSRLIFMNKSSTEIILCPVLSNPHQDS